METNLALLIAGVFCIAVLYSCVGHAGASGYIAVMSLLSIEPAIIKPTALALNILVATIASIQFARTGYFSWRLFWPFAVLAAPAAYAGGYLNLPTPVFKIALGAVLVFSAVRLLIGAAVERPVQPPPLVAALVSGAAIGFLSGLTGTGGGIFLTPLLLFMGWAAPKSAAGVSALFILFNSITGLLGNLANTQSLPSGIWQPLAAAGLGGLIGAYLGSRKVPARGIKRLLAVVLFIAGGKLLLTH